MTETFAIGRTGAPSPFREELVAEAEGFAVPEEPEYSPPDDGAFESTGEAFLGGDNANQARRTLRAALLVQGQSGVAAQASKQWTGTHRPSQWIGNVHGLVVHSTGGSLQAQADSLGVDHTTHTVNWYTKPEKSGGHGCHYVLGWLGVPGGDLLQIANEREQANGVAVAKQRLSIDQGNFKKDLPPVVVTTWQTRWPGVEHPLKLLPGTRTANSCYVHVECVPCVYGNRTHPAPMRPGLRFTQAQHEAVALLACDVARRNGWPLHDTWWRTSRLLGHEDLSPITRHDPKGGWDPGALREAPYFDWDFVYSMIERECRSMTAPAVSRPSWWPFSEAEDDELEQPGDQLDGEWEGEPETESDSEHEAEWETEGEAAQEGAWEVEVEDQLEDAYGNGLEGELEDESSFLEPFRLAMAIARGQRDEKTLTNGVFFARHPELGGRPIAPGERGLASEWIQIRDVMVRPLLSRVTQPTPSGSRPGGGALPAGPFGTLVLRAPGRAPFSYPFTAEDAAWTAKLVILEAGGRPDADSAAVIWAMFNRYALVRHTLYPTFHSFIRAYSTTLQPVLLNWKAAQRHLGSPEFVPSGGTYTSKGAPAGIPKGQLRRHLSFQAQPWDKLPADARTLTLQALCGRLPNPGIGLASEFVSTRILWMQANSTKREPTEQEWRSFTENFPDRVKKPYAWIGDVGSINQRKNAFFRYVADASLPPDAVTVTP